MCGIAGFYKLSGFSSAEAGSLVKNMATALAYRGPDDSGEWIDGTSGIALAHRRLSVVDLSPAGHQPMSSTSGRYVLVFNGEIYNHTSLRTELGEHDWRGHSDTETLLAAIDNWGFEAALKKSVGMFAFALWDRVDRFLYLARDRAGEKPLYYGWQGDTFLFASELKALQQHPGFQGDIDRGSLALFLRHGYIPAPYSIYRGIHKLLPGTFLRLPSTANPASPPTPIAYWSSKESWVQGQAHPFLGTDGEAITELESRLRQSVGAQMVADVPLGAFLSGGIDSSTIVALMQSQSTHRVKTFTIGFSERDYDEAEYARAVARHLGTDHTELHVTPSDAIGLIPRLPTIYDEPFADSSAIPALLVAQLARQKVTVSLSGDGGDELFGGYARYPRTERHWDRLKYLPIAGRRLLAQLLDILPPVAKHYPALPEALRSASAIELYRALVSQWPEPCRLARSALEPTTVFAGIDGSALMGQPFERMMYTDFLTYLPDDVLCKIDRAAMDVSLETRVPLLDHRIIEFVWSLPPAMKRRNNEAKWILRQILDKYVPRSLTDRPKKGFAVPVDHWLRGPLREWAAGLLNESRLQREGYLAPAPIHQRWEQHLSGHFNWRDPLWAVLMFQSWLDEQRCVRRDGATL